MRTNTQVIATANCRLSDAHTIQQLGSRVRSTFCPAMLVMTGGRERTEPEYRALLGRAGLRIKKVISTGTEVSLIEAIAA